MRQTTRVAIKAIWAWRPHTPFFYGWLVLGVSALGAFAATGVSQLVLGGIQNLIIDDLEWDRRSIALTATAGTWMAALLSPVMGRLVDRRGPRGLMPVAALVCGGAYLAIAGSRSLAQFSAAYVVARSAANPILIGVVPRTVAVNFFRRRRNLALGITSMARPVGGAILIQIFSLIVLSYSWRTCYRLLAVFILGLSVPLFLVMRRRPEDIGLRPDGDKDPDTKTASVGHRRHPGQHRGVSEREFDWRVGEAVLTPTFWLVVAAQSLIVLTSGSMGFQVVPYLRDSGFSQAVAAGALSLGSILGAVGNPAWGLLANRFHPRRLTMTALVITGSIMSVFLVIGEGTPRFFLIILWITSAGTLGALGQMMLARYFGRASFGSISGLMGPFQTGALGLGPSFGALLYGQTGGYSALFIFGVSAYAVAVVLVYGSRQPRLPRRAAQEGTDERPT